VAVTATQKYLNETTIRFENFFGERRNYQCPRNRGLKKLPVGMAGGRCSEGLKR
jgi:hypothetical protein